MPSWQETLILGTGLLLEYKGEVAACNASGESHLAVWPSTGSGGPKSEFVIIRPGANVYFACDVTNGGVGAGPHIGQLAADTNYAFPLHPHVNTLGFKALTSTGDVQVNWLINR